MKRLIKVFIIISLVLIVILTFSGCNKNKKGFKILYYISPNDPNIRSDKPKKDENGTDYIPVYEEEKTEKKLLYYVSPMNPSIKSDKPIKDEMGMDYIAVYEDDIAENILDSSNKDNITSIKITEQDEKLLNIQTTKVQYKEIDKTIKTYGKIEFDEQKVVHISSRFPGRIDKLIANFTGMKVYKGQALLLLYSPAVISAQEELIQAYNTGLNDNITKSIFESAKNKLRLWGISEFQIKTILQKKETSLYVPIYSPISGTITKMEVNSGMYVDEGMMMYEISDLSTVWLNADIYEQDISYIKINSIVEAINIAYPDKVFTGRINFINSYLDPMTRTVKIRAEFNNKDEFLKPGMYVDALIKISQKEKSLTIPDTALLDTGERKIVYVSLGEGRYVGRKVIVRPKIQDYYPVISGLSENEEIVTYGVYLLDSQAQIYGQTEDKNKSK